jgi:hypothetical protein
MYHRVLAGALLCLSVLGPRLAAARICGGTVACRCGDSLVASRVLSADDSLRYCTGTGLTISGKQNLTLSCGEGFQGISSSTSNGYGVYVENSSGITIYACQITGFMDGVYIHNSPHSTVHDSILQDGNIGHDWVGVGVDGNSNYSSVYSSTFTSTSTNTHIRVGMWIELCNQCSATYNAFSGFAKSNHVVVNIEGSTNTTLTNNDIALSGSSGVVGVHVTLTPPPHLAFSSCANNSFRAPPESVNFFFWQLGNAAHNDQPSNVDSYDLYLKADGSLFGNPQYQYIIDGYDGGGYGPGVVVIH